jgi:hypothetical protein
MARVSAARSPPTLILLRGLVDPRHGDKEGLFVRQAGQLNGQPVWRSLLHGNAWLVYSSNSRWILSTSPIEGSDGRGWVASAQSEYDIVQMPAPLSLGICTGICSGVCSGIAWTAAGVALRQVAIEGAMTVASLQPPLLLAAHLPSLAAHLPLLAGGLGGLCGGLCGGSAARYMHEPMPSKRFARLPCDSSTWQIHDGKRWVPTPTLEVRRVSSPADGDVDVPATLHLSANGAALRKDAVLALLGSYECVRTPLGTARLVNHMCGARPMTRHDPCPRRARGGTASRALVTRARAGRSSGTPIARTCG